MRKDGLKVRKRIGKDNFGIKMDQNRLYFQNILKFLRKDDSFWRKYFIFRGRSSESYATFGFN